jgi:hypothetical protein
MRLPLHPPWRRASPPGAASTLGPTRDFHHGLMAELVEILVV